MCQTACVLRVASYGVRGAGWWLLKSYIPALPAVGGLRLEA